MTEATKEALERNSLARTKLNELQSAAEPDSAAIETAQTEWRETEEALRTALAAEDGTETPAVDAEVRERRELRSRARVTDYVNATARGATLEGAAAEYAAAEGCVGMMPLNMLFGAPPETRAAATVAADAVAENPDPTAGEVFISPLAGRLGIRTPTVPAGQKSYPYIGTGVSPEAVAKGTDVGDSSPAIMALTATPRALSATFDFQREDAALLADLDSALSENIRQSLADTFDAQIIAGNNTDPNLNGLLTQRAPTAPADNTLTDFAALVAATSPFVDGTYADRYEQVELLMHPTVAHYLKSVYRGTSTQDSAYDWLMRNFAGITMSARVPTIAAVNHGTANNRRAGGGGLWGIRRRVPSLAYAPIWSGLQLVRDEITGAKSRTVTVTAYMLAGGVAIVRPPAYVPATIKTVQGVAA